MIASLPMYDWPEVQPAYDRLWASVASTLAEAGTDAPKVLKRDGDLWSHWLAPDLLLSQTCGLPYSRQLNGKVRKVGSPDYGLEGCPPGYYASKIVVRPEHAGVMPKDWADLRLVINEDSSQSGFGAIMNHAAKLGASFASVTASGAHRRSAQMVAEGAADIAAIDAHSFRMALAYDGWARDLVVIGQTDPTPATPFITAGVRTDEEVAQLRHALEAAVAGMTEDDRAVLHLYGVVDVPDAAYHAVPVPTL